jgi:hypothetical protein
MENPLMDIQNIENRCFLQLEGITIIVSRLHQEELIIIEKTAFCEKCENTE